MSVNPIDSNISINLFLSFKWKFDLSLGKGILFFFNTIGVILNIVDLEISPHTEKHALPP